MHGPHGLRIENYSVLDLHRRHEEMRPSMLVVHGHHLCNSMSLACRIRLEPHDQTESTKSGTQGVKRSSTKMQKFYSSYVCPQCFLFVLESKAKRRKIFDNRLRQKHVNQLISLGQSGERSIQSRMLDPKSCWKSQHQGIHPCSRVYVTYSHRYFHVPMIVLHLQYS